MSDLKRLIEEDIRAKLSSKGLTLAKYAKDVLRSKIGDERAAGRLDLRNLVAELDKSLQRFLGQQGKEATITSIAEYIKFVLGAEMPESVIKGLLPNQANTDLTSPNDLEIDELFDTLINKYKSMSPDQLKRGISQIVAYMEDDSQDEALIIEHMKYLRINHPEILELPEMEKLAPLGERVSDEKVEQLLIVIARNMMKNDSLAAAKSSNNPNSKADADADEDGNEENREKEEEKVDSVVSDIMNRNDALIAKDDLFETLARLRLPISRIEQWKQKDENGNTFFALNGGDIRSTLRAAYTIKEMNKLSALCLTIMAQNMSDGAFRSLVVDPFRGEQDFLLGGFEMIAKNGYRLSRDRKPISELSSMLDTKFKDEITASFLVMCCFMALFEVIDRLP